MIAPNRIPVSLLLQSIEADAGWLLRGTSLGANYAHCYNGNGTDITSQAAALLPHILGSEPPEATDLIARVKILRREGDVVTVDGVGNVNDTKHLPAGIAIDHAPDIRRNRLQPLWKSWPSVNLVERLSRGYGLPPTVLILDLHGNWPPRHEGRILEPL